MKKDKHTDFHHKKPRSNGGKTTDDNLVRVCKKKHNSWHNLFKNYHPEIVCQIINRVWIDTDFRFVCQKKVTLVLKK